MLEVGSGIRLEVEEGDFIEIGRNCTGPSLRTGGTMAIGDLAFPFAQIPQLAQSQQKRHYPFEQAQSNLRLGIEQESNCRYAYSLSSLMAQSDVLFFDRRVENGR